MADALSDWADHAGIAAVIIDHAEGRGFCAGGDIAMLRNSALNDQGKTGREFFHAEYQLNHQLFTYKKPVVAFMDGITMGGGVGISQPAAFRVATENTKFAMPETGIGLFPDVGGGWYLSRLPGRIGQFLALTGARLDGAECHAIGLATHYIASEKLARVKAAIIDDPANIQAILDDASETPPEARILAPESSAAQPSPSDVTPELASQPGVENSAVELPSEAELRRRLDILCVGCNGEPRGSCGRVPGLRATNTLIKHVINVVFAFFVERLALRCAS